MRLSTKACVRCLVSIALSLSLAFGLLELAPHRRVKAEGGGLEVNGAAGTPEGLIFLLVGPNDGEPLDGRFLRFRLITNCDRSGTLCNYLDGDYLSSQGYVPLMSEEGDAQVRTLSLVVDLQAASHTLGHNLLDPEAWPLVFTAKLYNITGSQRLAEQSLTVRLPAPWLEFSSTPQADGGGADARGQASLGGEENAAGAPAVESHVVPAGAREMRPHLLRGDTYFLMVASQERALLTRSPEDARLLREGQILGGTFASLEVGAQERTVCLESWTRSQSGAQAFVVLWSYSAEANRWRRSAIYSTR